MTEAEKTIDTHDDSRASGDAEPARTPPAADGGEVPAGGRRRVGVLALVAMTAYLLDLTTKIIAVEWLENRAPIEILGEWLRLEFVRNSGAAFGIGQALTIVFTFIAASVVIVILRLARKLYSAPWAVALGLLLGGALGNLTDRIFRAPSVFEGAVVDFISPKHFAVFNLADSAIVCGGILIVLLSFRGLDPDGTVYRDEPEETADSEPAASTEETTPDTPDSGDKADTADQAASDGLGTRKPAPDGTATDRPAGDRAETAGDGTSGTVDQEAEPGEGPGEDATRSGTDRPAGEPGRTGAEERE